MDIKFLLIVPIILLASCKVTQPIATHTDSVRVEYRLDSVYLYERDSIYVDRFTKADTIWVTTTKWKVRYKDVMKEVHDTITATQTQVVKEKYVPNYYKRVSAGFWVLLGILLLIAGWWVVKMYYKLKGF